MRQVASCSPGVVRQAEHHIQERFLEQQVGELYKDWHLEVPVVRQMGKRRVHRRLQVVLGDTSECLRGTVIAVRGVEGWRALVSTLVLERLQVLEWAQMQVRV